MASAIVPAAVAVTLTGLVAAGEWTGSMVLAGGSRRSERGTCFLSLRTRTCFAELALGGAYALATIPGIAIGVLAWSPDGGSGRFIPPWRDVGHGEIRLTLATLI